MTDLVIACDNFGRKLGQLPVSIQREYEMTSGVKASHGSFVIAGTDPMAKDRYLRYGNIVYVKSDQAGIPEWAGIIWPSEPSGTQINRNGDISVQLRSCEWLLATRCTATQTKLSGTPGFVFNELLKLARTQGFLPVSTAMTGINFGGDKLEPEYNLADIYTTVNQLAEDNNAFWGLTPSVDADTNTIILTPYWQFRKSRRFRGQLRTTGAPGISANFIYTSISEAAEIANHVVAYAQFDKWSDPVMHEESDPKSIGFYRQIYTKVLPCLDKTTREELIPIVQKYLNEHSFPPLKMNGVVVSPPFPRVGDVANTQIPNTGSFITTKRGTNIDMQVVHAVYSPKDTTLAISLEEVQ